MFIILSCYLILLVDGRVIMFPTESFCIATSLIYVGGGRLDRASRVGWGWAGVCWEGWRLVCWV